MSKQANDALRLKYIQEVIDRFGDEEIMRTGTGEIAFPVVDSDGEDNWVVISVKVPTGSRDGDPYDGYALAQEFEMNQAKKKAREEEAAAKKAAKVARDQKLREQKAAAKAAREKKEG